jgi:hypothetical protein
MAEQAGIINRDGPKDDRAFRQIIADAAPNIQELAYRGELPDPAGLLPTTGGRQASGRLAMRSMKITTLEQVRQPALRALLYEAVRHKVPAPTSKS